MNTATILKTLSSCDILICISLHANYQCSFVFFVCLFIFPATNKHNLFAVNETTGVISLNGSLDREAVSYYRLRVLVSLSVVKGLPVLIRNNLIPTKRSWCHPLEAENNARLRSRKTARRRTSGSITKLLLAVFLDFGVWTVRTRNKAAFLKELRHGQTV